MNLYYRIKNTISDFWYDSRCRCQHFKRGWAYGDVWDIDLWFMRTIKPMLIHLRDHGVGFPGTFNNRDEWKVILTEMINCLDMMDEYNVDKSLGFYDDDHLWSMEDYKRVYEIMEENKNRFFELFSKYFYAVWD